LTSGIDLIWTVQNTVQNELRDTYNATVVKASGIAGLLQNLIEIPVASSSSYTVRAQAYASLIDEFLTVLPGGSSQTVSATASLEDIKQSTSVVELSLMAAVAAMAATAATTTLAPVTMLETTPSISTRAQIIQAVEEMQATFEKVVAALENVQTLFATAPIDAQYVSLIDTYAAAADTLSTAIQFLFASSLKLSIERKFILDRPRTPFDIVVSEYGSLGKDEVYLDLFIRTNDLHGKDILLLPGGRQVVVYG